MIIKYWVCRSNTKSKKPAACLVLSFPSFLVSCLLSCLVVFYRGTYTRGFGPHQATCRPQSSKGVALPKQRQLQHPPGGLALRGTVFVLPMFVIQPALRARECQGSSLILPVFAICVVSLPNGDGLESEGSGSCLISVYLPPLLNKTMGNL
jgi:hypothetical protein